MIETTLGKPAISDHPPPFGAGRVKVLFVVNVLTAGGAERFVSTALKILDRRQFDPVLALFRQEIVYHLPEDVPVIIFEKRSKLHIPRTIWRLKNLIEKMQPDIVVTPHTGISFFAGEALRLTRHKPFWIARVANDPDSEDKGLYGLWAARTLSRADLFLANSRGLAAAFEKRYSFSKGRVSCLYNPTDFGAIDDLARQSSAVVFAERPVILSVGRLHPQKRFDVLIEGLSRVRRHVDASAVILGEGPSRQALCRDIERLGLGDSVQLPGFLDNPYAVMAKADLFVLSSDFEGLPNVLIEAQGLGLPVVAADCPYGPREIISPGETGLLVPPGNAGELAEAIVSLLQNPKNLRRMGTNAREKARQSFSLERIAHDLNSLLKRIIDQR